MAKSRKRIFPKPPIRFHSALAKTLGKNSNKEPEANVKAIYSQEPRHAERLSPDQLKTLRALHRTLGR